MNDLKPAEDYITGNDPGDEQPEVAEPPVILVITDKGIYPIKESDASNH